MFRAMLVVLAGVPTWGFAQEWVTLTDDAEITASLANRTVTFDALTFQYFEADGRTQYVTERSSDGLWEARGGQYCSNWPPSDLWVCYDFAVLGDQVRFTSGTGSVSEGVFEK